MWKVLLYVQDRHLAALLRACVGLTSKPDITPVRNAEMDGSGEPRQVKEGSIPEAITRAVRRRETITTTEAKAALKAAGLSPLSFSYALRYAIKAGLIRRTKKVGTYEVIK